MAYVATLQKTWVSGAASLVPTWVDTAAVETTTLITAFDGGNASSSTSTITGAGTTTPVIEIESRATDWRHLLFAVEGVEGKTPTFKLNRATMTDPAFTPTADFLPLWTQDFVTWTQASSRTLTGGTTGTIDFSFDAALPAGRVYVSTHPMGQNADAATFAAELLADYSSVASPTTSANTSGVYNTTPAETGDDGRAVGGNAQYAIKLAFGGSTTDGGPKRKLVMFAGIHAAGEHVSWIPFVAAVRHILDAPAAANFRANWDVYLYFNVTANGIVGGERRQNPSRNIDPNRDFVDQDLQEISALTTAILADTGGSATAQFGWHSFSTETDDFIPGTGESPNTETAAFITKGNTIFSSPRTYYLDIPTAGYRWGYDVLGAKIAFAAEVPMRGNTSVAFYETIGENWIKTLQAIDADGVFYSGTGAVIATGALQAQPATLAGDFYREIPASGALQSQAATVAGVATRKVVSIGALQAQPADVSGSSSPVTIVPATGALQAQPATVSGAATRKVVAAGNLFAQPATASGASTRRITSGGVLQSNIARVSGLAPVNGGEINTRNVMMRGKITVGRQTR